jgi:DnaK suppressor protein
MATTTLTDVSAKSIRYDNLKKMLEDRRCELAHRIQGKIRDARTDTRERRMPHQGEGFELDIQEDIEFALIQIKAETLNMIDAALDRLQEGTYGNCFECGDEIAKARLRALPFAVRCTHCEEHRETVEQMSKLAGATTRGSRNLVDR